MSTPQRSIAVVANCQGGGLAACVKALTGDPSVHWAQPGAVGDAVLTRVVSSSDVILVQHAYLEQVQALGPREGAHVVPLPIITFPAFHPDLVYLEHGTEMTKSPVGRYHSALALHGWTTGLSIKETLALFDENSYDRLGYFSYLAPSLDELTREGARVAMPLAALSAGWLRQGCFMHTVNHPKLFVLADIARAALAKAGVEVATPEGPDHVPDPMLRSAVWPLYPELARRWGLRGSYQFKVSQTPSSPVRFMDLEEFVTRSFRIYTRMGDGTLRCSRPDFATYADRLAAPTRAPVARKVAAQHPYATLPPQHFWRRAVEGVPMPDVDPVVRGGFRIARTDKVATAGSCFAQHIGRALLAEGYTHHVVERPPAHLSLGQAAQRQFGVFSARYGNIYSARQMLQLGYRAFGLFTPAETAWQREDGRFVDPFRPLVEAAGFETVEALEQARRQHLQAVRTLFGTLDVLVFTLGLTECWRSAIDGAVVPLPPGVAGCQTNPGDHEFVNFTATEVEHDLNTLVSGLQEVNPAARIVLTVSPVPLAATYEDRHVLTSTTYSKSALRVAAEAVAQRHAHVHYFPAYEVITGTFNRGQYFDADLRSVTAAGVEHVMRLFLRHYGQPVAAVPKDDAASIAPGIAEEIRAVKAVVCDEDRFDPA